MVSPSATHEYVIPVAGRPLRLLGPREPHALNQDPRVLARRAIDPEYHPHWALPWPGSVMLAERVLQMLPPSVGQVLEIGAGLGLAGLALARAGFHVIITDHDDDALAFVRASAARNNLTCATSGEHGRNRIARATRTPGPPSPAATGLPGAAAAGAMPALKAGMSEGSGSIETALLDWRHPPAEQFPAIIGADVAYCREHHEPLAGLLAACLAPGGDAFISGLNWRAGEAFPPLLEARGFVVAPYPATVAAIPAPGSIDGRTLRGVVWHIRRAK